VAARPERSLVLVSYLTTLSVQILYSVDDMTGEFKASGGMRTEKVTAVLGEQTLSVTLFTT
jgi:hypothetical protein